MNGNSPRKYETGLIIFSVVVVFAFVAYMALRPEQAQAGVTLVFNVLIQYFGTIMEVFVLVTFILSLYLATFSKYAHVRMGTEEPEYGLFSYIAMMALASLASALLYWSFTEWAYYYQTPGLGLEPESVQALEAGLGYSFFHWGPSANALFVMTGVVIAYAYYIRKVPVFQTSTVCQAMMGEKVSDGVKGILGKVIDFCVIFGILGGLGCSLGLAVPLAGGALTKVFGMEITFPVQVGIVVVIAIVFTITSFIGTEKGMKRISDASAILCGVMLLYIFITGPTAFIIKNAFNSLGWTIEMYPRMSLFTDPIANTGFPENWTMYFWAFCLNYAAMMGIFIAKISRGRTLREMILSAVFGISLGACTVFAVDSSFAIHTHITGTTNVVELVNSGVGEAGIYEILSTLPLGATVLPILLLIIMVGFVASSLDSASLSLAQTTQRVIDESGNVNPLLRVFWCVILTLIPLSIMFVQAEFNILKILSVIISIPFMLILIYMFIRFMSWIREDAKAGKLEEYGGPKE